MFQQDFRCNFSHGGRFYGIVLDASFSVSQYGRVQLGACQRDIYRGCFSQILSVEILQKCGGFDFVVQIRGICRGICGATHQSISEASALVLLESWRRRIYLIWCTASTSK